MPKDMEYYAKRGYLGQQKVIEANTPQMPPAQPVQENLAEVSQSMGGTGAQAQPVKIERQTAAEADNRNAVAAKRIQDQLDAGQLTPEQAAQIRSRLGLD